MHRPALERHRLEDQEAALKEIIEVEGVQHDQFHILGVVYLARVETVDIVNGSTFCHSIIPEIVRIPAAHLIFVAKPLCVGIDRPKWRVYTIVNYLFS